MKTSPLRAAALAAAGAALLGGGMFLGFVSALVRRKEAEGAGAAPASSVTPWQAAPDARLEKLASDVVELQKRLNLGLMTAGSAPEDVGGRLEEASRRIERLEKRVEQLANETSPASDVLAAVERMIGERIGALDQRLTEQVDAIETLRGASKQTDALLQRLIYAVESLGWPAGGGGPAGRPEGPEGPAAGPRPGYPRA